jgi:hypothetical protein
VTKNEDDDQGNPLSFRQVKVVDGRHWQGEQNKIRDDVGNRLGEQEGRELNALRPLGMSPKSRDGVALEDDGQFRSNPPSRDDGANSPETFAQCLRGKDPGIEHDGRKLDQQDGDPVDLHVGEEHLEERNVVGSGNIFDMLSQPVVDNWNA